LGDSIKEVTKQNANGKLFDFAYVTVKRKKED